MESAGPPPLPSDAFAHLPTAAEAVPALGSDPLLATAPQSEAKRSSGGREWAILGGATLLALFVILHRNGALFSFGSALGAEAVYSDLENAVLGPPSVDTPRGIRRFIDDMSKVHTPPSD